MPRVALSGAPGVGLPQPLAPSDAARVRHIFALQAAGSVTEAARETDRLDNRLLLGPILADRYLGGWSRPSAAELADWLAKFGDQPDAPAIRAMLVRLVPEPILPVSNTAPQRRNGTSAAAPVRSLFVQNRDAAAVAAGASLLSRALADSDSAEQLFAAGLSAWRLGDAVRALSFFAAAHQAAPAAALRAGAAFWAARAAKRQADRSASVVWLRRAAQETDTFYGRIAGRALGSALACHAAETTLGNADIDAMLAAPEGRRAFAFLQIGEKRRAETEFRTLWADSGEDPGFARPLALVARAVGLPQFAAELRAASPLASGPAPPELHPAGGFVVDPSLIYALVHHESNFHAAVVSHSGARGLMQLMPSTARAVSGDRSLSGIHIARLEDPAVNLAVGQRYLLQLSDDDSIDGDLVRLLAGYGQGLFGLKRWADSVNDQGDPLLFVEAIPNASTRGFVKDTLAWSWHYAAALRLPAASLDALAAGHFPRLMRAGALAAEAGATACGMAAASH